ncbi:MAG: HAD family hydrolase [Proteocatella sp.]
MKKLAIFDLDGTLISSLQDLTSCVNKAFDIFEIPPVTNAQCMKALGHGARMLIHDCLVMSGRIFLPESEFEGILDTYNNIYGEDSKSNTVPFDGIIEMLSKAREMGYKTAIVSNKPHAFTVDMSEKMFGDLIDFTYGQSEDFAKKPDPSIIYHLIEESGFKPSEAVYIGDSDVDVITAKNAAITSIAVTWGYRPKQTLVNEQPDYIVDSVPELEELLNSLFLN